MVKQYLHVTVCCSRHKTLLGVTQNQLNLFSRYAGEPLEELIDPCPVFEIFEQGPYRYTAVLEQPLAAALAVNAFHRCAFAPV